MATIRLSEELEERLSKLAQLTGRTKTFYIRKLLEDNIDDLEDLYTAEHRLANPAGFVDLDEALSELDINPDVGD